jgi:PKD repeat protein
VALNLTLNAGIGFDSYLWSTGATTQSLAANAPGLYWVEVTAGNCTLRDSIQITQAPISIELGGDTAICEGTSLTLSPGNNFATYLWQNNSTASSLTVSTQGAYSVTVTDANNCQASDNIFVSVLPPPTANFGSSSNGLVVTFDNTSNGATAYEWDLGDNTFSTLQDPTHTYTAAGTYVVCLRAVVLNNCEDVFCDTITVTTTTGLPNTFTQLGLNLYPNQTTGPLTLTSPTPLGTCHLQVLNATGQLVATYQYASAGNVLQLSVAQLPAGSYILRLNGPHGEAFARFIRQ